MNAQDARVIDLDQYRRRREEQRERTPPVMPVPLVWVPVWGLGLACEPAWFWVPVWPVI